MKKLLCVLLFFALMLCCACSCSDDKVEVEAPEAEEPVESETMEETAEKVFDAELPEMPELTDDALAVQAPSTYQYSTLVLENIAYKMEYPSHWERVPGSKSVCFVEPESEGHTPGRVVVTFKSVSSTKDERKRSEMASYLNYAIGSAESYELGELNEEDSFLGSNTAYGIEYVQTTGGVTYRGYAVMTNIDKTLVVFHFRCADADFESMRGVMQHIKDSIAIGTGDK